MRTKVLALGLGVLGLAGCSSKAHGIPAAATGDITEDAGAPAAAPTTIDTTGFTTTANCPTVSPTTYAGLTADTKLPDPFMSMDGTRIASVSDWTCRRNEIGIMAQAYELGPKPNDAVTVTAQMGMVPAAFPLPDGGAAPSLPGINVTVARNGQQITFGAAITLPTTGTPPYPAFIGMDTDPLIGLDVLHQEGVATIVFPASQIAVQNDSSSRGQGMFYTLYGSTHAAGAMIAWAWGVSRLIDALQSTPDAMIDTNHLGITGCSRDGKGALVVGAFDERIALTIPQESGSGGSASWRISDAQTAAGTVVQTLSEITGENTWFTLNFRQFNNTSTHLPFDHHELEAMVAPRALLVIENTSQVWLGNVSTYNNSMAAHLVWEGLGIPDNMGVSQVGDHSHCQWNGSQQPEVTAFVQKFLLGDPTTNTKVLKTDAASYCAQSGACTPYTFDQTAWVDWTVPTLN